MIRREKGIGEVDSILITSSYHPHAQDCNGPEQYGLRRAAYDNVEPIEAYFSRDMLAGSADEAVEDVSADDGL